MAVGQGRDSKTAGLVALDVRAGDRILFAVLSSETELDGAEYIIMREDDVSACESRWHKLLFEITRKRLWQSRLRTAMTPVRAICAV